MKSAFFWSATVVLLLVLNLSGCGGAPAVSANPSGSASPNSASSSALVTSLAGGANVVTWHYDNARTGMNANEATLTTANVNSGSFGKLFSYLVDGYVYAQPLYVSNLTIGNKQRNVVFIATENDSVYAFDADQYGSGSPLWKVSLLGQGETPQPGKVIHPVQGITSTPAIDLSSNTMYVVSTQNAGTSEFFRLHALDLITGAEKFGGPVVITASVPGTNNAVNGTVSLSTSCLQRSALLLASGTVYIGFGNCTSGWLLAYDAQSLAGMGVFNMGPTADVYGKYGGAGGVWMGGAGPAADAKGNVYLSTGDGTYDGVANFGNSVMKFNAQLQLLDYFAPFDWAFQQCRDADLGSGGVLLLPNTSQLLAGGKTGKMYLLNTANLGKSEASDAGATQTLWFEQDLSAAYLATCTDDHGNVLTGDITGYQIFATGAVFKDTVYLGIAPSTTSVPGPVRAFPFAYGQLTPGAITQDNIQPASYGTTPFITASGTANGIVWVIDHGNPIENPAQLPPSPAVLRAYDAANPSTELYNSSQNSADVPGYGMKFSSPIVANGKVFIATAHDLASAAQPQGELDVYGLRH